MNSSSPIQQQRRLPRVLLVTTSAEDILARARSVAMRQGFEFRPVELSSLGAETCEVEEGSVLLLDLRLGGPIDAGALAALRCDPRLVGFPIIALVGDRDDAAMRDAISAGADHFVRESFLERELPLKLLLAWRMSERRREDERRDGDLDRFEEIHRRHPDGILLIDPKTDEVLTLNPAARRIFRLEGDLRTHRLFIPHLAPFDDEEAVRHLIRVAALGQPTPFSTFEVTWPVERTYLEMGASQLDGGEVLLAARDITERKQLDTLLLKKEESAARHAMIVELAGAAAHELNQPLTVVLGYAQLLAKKLDDGSVPAKQVASLRQEAERMAEIVKKLAQIMRYETTEYVEGAKIIDLDRSSPTEEEAR